MHDESFLTRASFNFSKKSLYLGILLTFYDTDSVLKKISTGSMTKGGRYGQQISSELILKQKIFTQASSGPQRGRMYALLSKNRKLRSQLRKLSDLSIVE